MEEQISELVLRATEVQEYLNEYINESFIDINPEVLEIESRIKSRASILRKFHAFAKDYNNNVYKIPDILGYRMSLENEEQIQNICKILEIDFQKEIYKIKEWNTENGFKAIGIYMIYHLLPVEFQIMTKTMRDWVNRTHDEHELKKYGSILDEEEKIK